jgi:hypothetical protein
MGIVLQCSQLFRRLRQQLLGGHLRKGRAQCRQHQNRNDE